LAGPALEADLAAAVPRAARLGPWLAEGRGSAVDGGVLHAEARAVPRALDLAAVLPDELPLVQGAARVGAGVPHHVDGAVERDDEEVDPALRLRDDGLPVRQRRRGQLDLLPFLGDLGPGLPVHLGAEAEGQ